MKALCFVFLIFPMIWNDMILSRWCCRFIVSFNIQLDMQLDLLPSVYLIAVVIFSTVLNSAVAERRKYLSCCSWATQFVRTGLKNFKETNEKEKGVQ